MQIYQPQDTSISFLVSYCSNGIRDGSVCCPSSCGQCGGAGCGDFPGGATQCCYSVITLSGVICQTSSDTACIVPGN